MDPTAQAISRDDAINMLAQMDHMRSRLYSLHPDLKEARQGPRMEFTFLPGSADGSTDPQGDAGQLSGFNPRSVSVESTAKPVMYQGGVGMSQPAGEYQANAAVATATKRGIPGTLAEYPADVLSESQARAIKDLIRSQLNAAHEAEAIKDLIRTEVQKHNAGKGMSLRLPPLVDDKIDRLSSAPPGMKLAAKGLDMPNESAVLSGESPAADDMEDADTLHRAASAPHEEHPSFKKKKGDHRKRSMEAIDDHTGALYPATAVAPGAKHRHDDDEDEDDGWDSTAENAYGAFIHTTLQGGFWMAVYKCGPMLVTSVLIQFVFAYELYRALPTVESAPMFCQIPWDLQMAAIGVFVTLMLDNIMGMYTASRISLASVLWKESDDDSMPQDVHCNFGTRLIVFVVAVVSEVATWFGIFSAGVLFILTAESVDLVIRSTVAIMFVQNVDEIIFESCCSRQVKDSLRGTRYKLVDPLARLGVKKTQAQTVDHLYSLFLHLPVIVLITSSIVLGLRAEPEIDCLK